MYTGPEVELYTKKAFISGNTVEVYEYSSPLALGIRPMRISRAHRRYARPRTLFSLKRSKQKLRRLVQANSDLTKFMTLTFKENVSDFDVANKHFSIFVKSLEKAIHRRIKYICVPEFQKRGAIHFHILCDLPYLDHSFLTTFWSHGSLNIQRIRSLDKTARYVTKYITPDFLDARFYGKKIIFYPYKLMNKTKIIFDGLVDLLLAKRKHELLFKASFSSMWTPSCNFYHYRLS